MKHMTYPQVEQFETRDSELRAATRLQDEQRAASREAGRANRLQRLAGLTFTRVGGR